MLQDDFAKRTVDNYIDRDCQNELGEYIWLNGNVYEGEYVNGTRNGLGEYIWLNGNVYEAEYVNGKEHGHGKVIMQNLTR